MVRDCFVIGIQDSVNMEVFFVKVINGNFQHENLSYERHKFVDLL